MATLVVKPAEGMATGAVTATVEIAEGIMATGAVTATVEITATNECMAAGAITVGHGAPDGGLILAGAAPYGGVRGLRRTVFSRHRLSSFSSSLP